MSACDPEMFEIMKRYWDDPDAALETYKAQFALRSPQDRVNELKITDGWLSQETRATREHATLLTHRRELGDIHFALRRAGR